MEREGLLVYKLYINNYVEWLVYWEMALGGSCPFSPFWCTTNTHRLIMRQYSLLYLTAFAVVKPIG